MLSTIVVTGAAGRLGRVVCARLVRAGFRVVGLVRGGEQIDGVEAVKAELSDEAQVARAFDAAGPIWGLVHCAGGWAGANVADTSLAVFEQMMEMNLRSTFLCCREALRRMPREGRIVNVAAFGPATFTGIAGQGAYAASKAAVIALTKAIAAESTVRANCVAPGTLRNATVAEGVPMEDVAEAIAYLVSHESGAASGSVVLLPAP